MKPNLGSVVTLVLGVSLAIPAMAQRGRPGRPGPGGPGGHQPVVQCHLDDAIVGYLAEELQKTSFSLREEVSNLPRPELWMPTARPIGAATRSILAATSEGRSPGTCRTVVKDLEDAKDAIDAFQWKLYSEGRGVFAQKIFFKLRQSEHAVEEFEKALLGGSYGGF